MPKKLASDASLRDVVVTLPHPRAYFANVWHFMKKAALDHGPMKARIGITGAGIMPNFRIENADASFRQAYDGVSFAAFPEKGSIDSNWSTSVTTTQEVFDLLQLEVEKEQKTRSSRSL